MKKKIKRMFQLILVVFVGISVFTGIIYAQENTEALKPFINSIQKGQSGMTVWEMVNAGGFIMIVLAGLSFLSVSLIIYNFLTTNQKKLFPTDFAEMVIQHLEKNDSRGVRELCSLKNNIISRTVLSGMRKKKRGDISVREAMESSVKKDVLSLWQNITYLSDVATIAPLVGLLGTVLGMMQAFNVVAFQTAVVKPILLAGGVSKAMITTAGGLIVAIPTMMFYAYLRGRVQKIANTAENYCTDIIKLVVEL